MKLIATYYNSLHIPSIIIIRIEKQVQTLETNKQAIKRTQIII